LSGFLARRGFSYEVIAPVVSALWEQRSANNNTDEEKEEE
jgi:SOS response regulatory protein OraA/RecX